MTMDRTHWQYWRKELAAPGSQPRNEVTVPVAGYWRADGAKSKPSWPVAVWYDDDGTPHHKVGNSQKDGHDEFSTFLTDATWSRCVAVEHADYLVAMDTGRWASDGKHARNMTEAELHDIDLAPGANAAPVEDTIEEQIAAAVAKADAIKVIKTEDEARVANELAAKLKLLFDMGDTERIKEKRPHDEAAAGVQAKWLPIINPASTARERLVGKDGVVKRWLKAEQARIDEEANQARLAQQAEDDRIRQENEKAAAEAADKGESAPAPIPAPEPPPAAAPQRARAGSTFGRATGLRKVTRAKITDIGKLLQALSTHKEMLEFAQTLANRAAKAGIPLDGMEIEEVME
jgi:hypothetical protein